MHERELPVQQSLHFLHSIGGDDDIEIEADDRLDVRVETLTADEAERYAVRSEEREEALQKIRVVHGDRLPESGSPHSRPIIAAAVTLSPLPSVAPLLR